jgi:hypothetical protein
MTVANEIYAVMVLNADGSVLDNIMVVHPRISSALLPNFSHRRSTWLDQYDITIR